LDKGPGSHLPVSMTNYQPYLQRSQKEKEGKSLLYKGRVALKRNFDDKWGHFGPKEHRGIASDILFICPSRDHHSETPTRIPLRPQGAVVRSNRCHTKSQGTMVLHNSISELPNSFTSQAARDFLSPPFGSYEDGNTCPSTDSSLNGDDPFDVESESLNKVDTVHPVSPRFTKKKTFLRVVRNHFEETAHPSSPRITRKQVYNGPTKPSTDFILDGGNDSLYYPADDVESQSFEAVDTSRHLETFWDVSESRAPKENRKKPSRRHREHKEQNKVKFRAKSKQKPTRTRGSSALQDSMKSSKHVIVEANKNFIPDVNPETESRTQEHLRDANAAQKRLDALRGSTDTRDHVTLWNDKRYCHRMFRHRAQVDYPNETCMELWEVPEQMSVSKTFSQVHIGAESIARWVAAACAETTTKDKVICLYLPRGYELIASVIGVWYAGACLNVTDTKLPWDRLEYIVGDASAAMVITTPSLVGENPKVSCPILNVNAVIADGTETDKAAPIWLSDHGLAHGVVVPELGEVSDKNIEDDDSCVCIYTSGSTGEFK